jgi:hypothetical protein
MQIAELFGKRRDTIIFTSFWAFAEVFKAKCEGQAKPLVEAQDKNIEALFRQAWIQPVVIDGRIGTASRRLMRQHPECKKPSDAVHLATALAFNVDEMHTYDKVMRADGVPLKICAPYVSAPPLPLPIPPIGSPTPQQQSLPLDAPTESEDDGYIIEWITEADLDALEREGAKA